MVKDLPPKLDGVGLLGSYPNPNSQVPPMRPPATNDFEFKYDGHRGSTGTGVFLPGFSSVGTGVFPSGFSSVQHSNTSKVNLSGFSSSKVNRVKKDQFPTLGANGSLSTRKGTGVFLPRVINNDVDVDIRTKPTDMKTDQQQKESMGFEGTTKQEAPSLVDDEALLLEFNLPQEWTY